MIRNLARNNKLFGTDTTDELNSAFQKIDDRITDFQAPDKEAKVPVSIINIYSNHPNIRIGINQSRKFGNEKWFDVTFKSDIDITADTVLPLLRTDIEHGNIFGHIQYSEDNTTYVLESYTTGTQIFGRFPDNKVLKNVEYRFVAISV